MDVVNDKKGRKKTHLYHGNKKKSYGHWAIVQLI